jgi:hypothetical protein
MRSNSDKLPHVDNFQVGGSQTDTIYYNTSGSDNRKLDINRLQAWIFDKNHVIINATADPLFDRVTYDNFENILGKKIEDILDTYSMQTRKLWQEIIDDAFRMIETKRTTIMNNILTYIDCKPLFYGNDIDDLYAVLLIIIPYEVQGHNIGLFDKKYITIVNGKRISHKPDIDILQDFEYTMNKEKCKLVRILNYCTNILFENKKDTIVKSRNLSVERWRHINKIRSFKDIKNISDQENNHIGKIRLSSKIRETTEFETSNRKNIKLNKEIIIKVGIPYELDLSRFQIWIFNKQNICIYSTNDNFFKEYPIEYYIGKDIDSLDLYDISVWKWAINNALDFKRVKKTILYNGEVLYLEAKPLIYNDSFIYGAIIILIPYLTS